MAGEKKKEKTGRRKHVRESRQEETGRRKHTRGNGQEEAHGEWAMEKNKGEIILFFM